MGTYLFSIFSLIFWRVLFFYFGIIEKINVLWLDFIFRKKGKNDFKMLSVLWISSGVGFLIERLGFFEMEVDIFSRNVVLNFFLFVVFFGFLCVCDCFCKVFIEVNKIVEF